MPLSPLDMYPLQYEEVKPKKGEKMRTNTTKQADAIAFDTISDMRLIAGTARTLYARHRSGLWMTIALGEFIYIVWTSWL